MVAGSMMLIDSTQPFGYVFKVSWHVIFPAALLTTVIFGVGMILVAKSQKKRPITGKEGLMDAVGLCRTEINPEGKIFVHGELWTSTSDEVILPGEKVRVVGIEGLTLRVKKVDVGSE